MHAIRARIDRNQAHFLRPGIATDAQDLPKLSGHVSHASPIPQVVCQLELS